MQKWSPEEDNRLKKLVKKHGNQWKLISKQMKTGRTENAVLKRWKGYVKKEVDRDEALKEKVVVKGIERKGIVDPKKKQLRSDDKKQSAPIPPKTKIIYKAKAKPKKFQKPSEKNEKSSKKYKNGEQDEEGSLLQNQNQSELKQEFGQESQKEESSEGQNCEKSEEQNEQSQLMRESQIQTKKLRSHAHSKKNHLEQKDIKNSKLLLKKPVQEKRSKPIKKETKKEDIQKKQDSFKLKQKKDENLKEAGNEQNQDKKEKEDRIFENKNHGNDAQRNEQLERINDEQIKKMIGEQHEWLIEWSEEKDSKLANLIISQHFLDWESLASYFKVSIKEIQVRWVKIVFPKMRTTVKIGGAVKWCPNEDSILLSGDKKDISLLDLMYFLPGRTIYSMQARWRRISRSNEHGDKEQLTISQPTSNSCIYRNDILTKIALKRKERRKQEMNKIFERQRQIMERKKRELQHFKLFEKSKKN